MARDTTAAIILATWERAYGLGPVDRGLALLSLAQPTESIASLAELTIGERDAGLLDLRSHLFGTEIQSLDACPSCEEKIEVTFNVSDIRVVPPTLSGTHAIEVAGGTHVVRAATSADLVAVESLSAARNRRSALLNRCVSRSDGPRDAEPDAEIIHLAEADLRVVVDKMSEIDPQADIRIALDCSQCGHAWSSRFDIASYLWTEIDAWAQRLLAEVHALAFAYGWSEGDILGMSAWRRHIYLGMLRR